MRAISGEFIDIIVLNKLLMIYISMVDAKNSEDEIIKNFHIKQAQMDLHNMIELLEKKINE